MKEATGGGHMIYGFHANGKTKLQLPWHQRCLSAPGMSLFGLIHGCYRLGWQKPQGGGARDDTVKKAAVELVEGLCGGALKHAAQKPGGASSFMVELDPSWTSSYPRPAPASASKFLIRATEKGLDFAALRTLAKEEATSASMRLTARWWTALNKVWRFGDDDLPDVDLSTFFHAMAYDKSLRALAAQICAHLAVLVEEASLAKPEPGKQAKGCIRLKTFDFEDIFSQQSDAYLAQYMLAGVEASANQNEMGLSSDKGQVCGLPLQNTFMVFPTNDAVSSPPVVDLRSTPLPRLRWTRPELG